MKVDVDGYMTTEQLHELLGLGPDDVIHGDSCTFRWSAVKQKWIITALVGNATG